MPLWSLDCLLRYYEFATTRPLGHVDGELLSTHNKHDDDDDDDDDDDEDA